MCLYTKQICPLRARKDIVCYKRFKLLYGLSIFNLMVTPIRDMMVRIPKDEPTVMIAYPDSIEKVRTIDTTRDRDNARFRIYEIVGDHPWSVEDCQSREEVEVSVRKHVRDKILDYIDKLRCERMFVRRIKYLW